eukprot:s3202_g4.t1
MSSFDPYRSISSVSPGGCRGHFPRKLRSLRAPALRAGQVGRVLQVPAAQAPMCEKELAYCRQTPLNAFVEENSAILFCLRFLPGTFGFGFLLSASEGDKRQKMTENGAAYFLSKLEWAQPRARMIKCLHGIADFSQSTAKIG